MDSTSKHKPFSIFLPLLLILPLVSSSTGIFKVQHKFNRERSLAAFKSHDIRRHTRMLAAAAVDVPLGGNGSPTDTGLYYTKIKLGTPPKHFHVQVDTGSDILWVNCIQCTTCQKHSSLGIELTLYDPKASATGKLVTCDDDFCTLVFQQPYPGCVPNSFCEYKVEYADGSATSGYYVGDYIHYPQASGNSQTSEGNTSVFFGCGAKQYGNLGSSDQTLDGIIGFGQANSSIVSQLAAAGKVKKEFSHCLDGQNGGGIFAIGEVVEPKVKKTPLIPQMSHYNVNLTGVLVGKTTLDIPSHVFETTETQGTIIDSGTTLTYLPEVIYLSLMRKILESKPDLNIHTVQKHFQCFEYDGSVDDAFPTVTFRFEGSLDLMVYPHEYLFMTRVDHEDFWCLGWQNSGLQPKEGQHMTLLGDLVLSNKLVVYDLEEQAIGWTEYNCSGTIKLEDDQSGSAYSVGAHDLSSACSLGSNMFLMTLVLSAMVHIIYL